MKDRGMKKYLPYKSLVEQEDFLNNIKKAKTLVRKPILLEDEQELINNVLRNLKNGDLIKVKFYQNGEILFFSSKFKQIDIVNRSLVLEHKRIPLDDLLGVKKI